MIQTEPSDSTEIPDAELLGRYARSRDDLAFSTLVNRHGPMVLAICRRSLGDTADADDAFQATFLVLSIRLASIREPNSLAAWLWSVARQAAKDIKVSERRRSAREQRWGDRNAMRSDSPSVDPELKTILEIEIDRLSAKYRGPVIMCYLEGKTNRDAAQLLGLPLGTLATRLREARELLRRRLARKGVNSSADAVTTTLALSLAPAALPPHLSGFTLGSISSGAPAAHASVHAVTVAKKVALAMSYAKAKVLIAAVLAAIALGGGTAAILYRGLRTSGAHAQALAQPLAIVEVNHPATERPAEPQFSWQSPPAVRGPARKAYNGKKITGYVHDVDGKPFAGAKVLLSSINNLARLFLDSGAIVSTHPTTSVTATTGADGQFEITPNDEPLSVVVTCAQGIGFADASEDATAPSIVIQPWGRVDGTAHIGTRAAARAAVMVRDWDEYSIEVGTRRPVSTDTAGHFTIDHLPRGRITIGFAALGSTVPEHWYFCDIKSGKTTAAAMGGGGRVLVGRIVPAVTCNWRQLTLTVQPPEPFASALRTNPTVEQQQNLDVQARNSPQLQQWLRDFREPYAVTPESDGSFHLQDVPPGKYDLEVSYQSGDSNSHYVDNVGSTRKELVIESAPPGTESAVNLGQIPLSLAPRLETGQIVPDIIGLSSAGKKVALSDFRGKYTLLTLVRGDNDQLWNEILEVRALYDRFLNDQRFALVTVQCPAQSSDPPISPEIASLPWTRMLLTSDAAPQLPPVYAASRHPMLLIDPRGALLAKNLDAQRAFFTVDRLLAHGSDDTGNAHIQVDFLPNAKVSPTSPYAAVPGPSRDNAATTAEFSVIDGLRRPGPNALSCLCDGLLPLNDNDAKHSFYFQGGTFEGRLRIDLGQALTVGQVNTYSWHRAGRAPQVYVLYGSDGSSKEFDPSPMIGHDPAACGWTRIGTVDTRPATGSPGGRYAVAISGRNDVLGTYRYFLFEMFPTETVDAFGHTFYGEIQVRTR